MNRNFLKYLAIFIVAATISVSAVMATNLVEHDFNGNFKADVPSNADFEKSVNGTNTIYLDGNNDLLILYSENDDINDDTIDAFYYGFTKDGTFSKKGTDGDLTIFEISDDDLGKYGAGIYTDGKVVIICGKDLNLVKDIANSVEF